MPSKLLGQPVLQNLHLHANFRQIEARAIRSCPTFDGLNGNWQFQTLDDWLGVPAISLEALYQEFESHKLKTVVLTNPSSDLEAYVASLNQPQFLRWRSINQIRKNGRYLLRSRTFWGQISYSIGEIENCLLKMQESVPTSCDIRRLCYALDDKAKAPTSAVWSSQQGMLRLRSELPARERKQLATLGTLQENDKYYPRIWHVSPEHADEVREILSSLCIKI